MKRIHDYLFYVAVLTCTIMMPPSALAQSPEPIAPTAGSSDMGKTNVRHGDVQNIGNRDVSGRIYGVLPNQVSLEKEIALGQQMATEFEQTVQLLEDQQVVGAGKNSPHRRVVCNYREDDIRAGGYFAESLRRGATQLLGEGCSRASIHIINRRDVKTALLQSPRHVRTHPANADKSDLHIFSYCCFASGHSERTRETRNSPQAIRAIIH
jgi:hypothetical protein